MIGDIKNAKITLEEIVFMVVASVCSQGPGKETGSVMARNSEVETQQERTGKSHILKSSRVALRRLDVSSIFGRWNCSAHAH